MRTRVLRGPGLLLVVAACSRVTGPPLPHSTAIETKVTSGPAPSLSADDASERLAFRALGAVSLPDGRRAAIVDGRRVLYDAKGAPTIVPGSVLLGSRIWSLDPDAGGGFFFRSKREGKPWEGEADGPEIWRADRFDGELVKIAVWAPASIEMGPGFVLSAESEAGPTEAHEARSGRPLSIPVPTPQRAFLHQKGFGIVLGKEQGFYTRGQTATPLGPVRHVVAGADAFFFLDRELPTDYPQDLGDDSRRRMQAEADRSWKKVDGTGTIATATASEVAPLLADEARRSGTSYALRALVPDPPDRFETEAELLARRTPLPEAEDEKQRQDVSVVEGTDGTQLAMYRVLDHVVVVRDLKTHERIFYRGLPRLSLPRLLEASQHTLRYEGFEDRNGLPSQAVFVDLDRRTGVAKTSTLAGNLLTPVLSTPRGVAIDRIGREALWTRDAGRTWQRAGAVPAGFLLEGAFTPSTVWCARALCRVGAVEITFANGPPAPPPDSPPRR